MLSSLDAAAVRRWCAEGLAALRRHQVEIDALNVFPVPDGDTGTNLVLTLQAAADALAAEPDERPPADGPGGARASEGEMERLGRVLRCMARGALLGARGNSGVIVSQLLRGIADALAVAPAARGRALAGALSRAADVGYAAVAAPVEGTVLSVARGAADAAAAADSDDLAAVTAAAAAGAATALDRTPEQLDALARAGVVDAGGRGLVVLLDALDAVVRGVAPGTAPLARVAADPALLAVEREEAFGYEVQYLLDATPGAVDVLRDRLAALGDSLVIVGAGDGVAASGAGGPGDAGSDGGPVDTWNVHVHVDDVGAAVEAGVEAGRPHRITVTRFADAAGRGVGDDDAACAVVAADPDASVEPARPASPADRPASPAAGAASAPPPGGPASPADGAASAPAEGAAPAPADDLAPAAPVDPDSRGIVAVAAGPGLARLFAEAGAVPVDPGPSTADLLRAVAATGAASVVVLPNAGATQGVADLAAAEARAAGRTVSVLHTRSPLQGLAALAVADADRSFADEVLAMAEAAAATRWAEIGVAARDALTVAGPCRAGDVVALVDGEVVLVGRDLEDVGAELVGRMLGAGGELVTLVTGAAAPEGLADALVARIRAGRPFVECTVYPGGQPHHPLLVGVE